MSKEGIGRLREALARDPLLRSRLEEARTLEAVVALAREAGCAITIEELSAAFPSQGTELSKQQLESIAGGSGRRVIFLDGGFQGGVRVGS
jgi:predicted ribosomally synthesized peptide with nif11-like leader